MTSSTKRLFVFFMLVLCGSAFYAGQRFERARLMPIIDESVRLVASWQADCHCPGPEECSMQATCNAAALHCCFELEQVRGQGGQK